MLEMPIYDINKSNSQRYTLGNCRGKTLFVMGVNPSQATNQRLDHTVGSVKKFSEILGFDSFLMLNVYPQRATDPNDLSLRLNRKAHEKNLEMIGRYIGESETIWAAWGNLISKRKYLKECLFDIDDLLRSRKVKWIQYDLPTKEGHPKHPARKRHGNFFNEFDMNLYRTFLNES